MSGKYRRKFAHAREPKCVNRLVMEVHRILGDVWLLVGLVAVGIFLSGRRETALAGRDAHHG